MIYVQYFELEILNKVIDFSYSSIISSQCLITDNNHFSFLYIRFNGTPTIDLTLKALDKQGKG